MDYLKEIPKTRLELRRLIRQGKGTEEDTLTLFARLGLYYKNSARPGVHGHRSHFWYANHFYSKALNRFDPDTMSHNNYARICNNYGVLLRHLRKYDEAEKLISRSVKYYTSSGRVDSCLFERMNLAMVYFRSGKLEQAFEVFSEVNDSNLTKEEEVFGHVRTAEFYAEQGDWGRADIHIRKAIFPEKEGNLERRTQLLGYRVFSQVLVEWGKTESAIEFATKAVKQGEEWFGQSYWTACLYINLARILEETKDPQARYLKKHGEWLVGRCLQG